MAKGTAKKKSPRRSAKKATEATAPAQTKPVAVRQVFRAADNLMEFEGHTLTPLAISSTQSNDESLFSKKQADSEHSTEKRSILLRFPAEIRNKIYEEVFGGFIFSGMHHGWTGPELRYSRYGRNQRRRYRLPEGREHIEAFSLALVNWKLYLEAGLLLISLNTFTMVSLMGCGCCKYYSIYTCVCDCQLSQTMFQKMVPYQLAAITTIQVSISTMETIGRDVKAIKDKNEGFCDIWDMNRAAKGPPPLANLEKILYLVSEVLCPHADMDCIRLLWKMEGVCRVLVDYRSDFVRGSKQGREAYDLEAVTEGVRFCTGKADLKIMFWDRLKEAKPKR
jgi:hypothetical protein